MYDIQCFLDKPSFLRHVCVYYGERNAEQIGLKEIKASLIKQREIPWGIKNVNFVVYMIDQVK